MSQVRLVAERCGAFAGGVVLVSLFLMGTATAVPELVFTVPDTAVTGGQNQAYLSVHMDNYMDTVAGFQFVLVSQRPDLIRFDFSSGGFDTAGTLVSGFEWVSVLDPSGNRSQYWFRCIANADPFDGRNYWGFPPQQGGIAVRIPLEVTPTPMGDPYCPITVTTPFDFSNPTGLSIGVVTDTLYDTNYYRCTVWENGECLTWVQVNPGSPYDSIEFIPHLHGYLDTTRVIRVNGSVTVLALQNCDMDGSGSLDIGDLSCLISALFGSQAGPTCQNWCDADLSGVLDISDLTMLVEYLFFGGPPPRT